MAGAVAALAGCTDGMPKLTMPGFSKAVQTRDVVEAAPVARLALFDGQVTAAGPNGYCADPIASKPDSGFAIFASCNALGLKEAATVLAGITTVQVGRVGSAIVARDPDAFVAVLSSAQGPSILARSGDSDSVEVKRVTQRKGRVTVALNDAAPAFIEGAQEAEWRTFFDLADRLVTVTVRGFDARPLSDAAGMTLLTQAVRGMIAANGPQTASLN